MFLDKKAQLTLAPMLMAPICNTSHSTQPSQTSQKPYATMLGIKLDMSISSITTKLIPTQIVVKMCAKPRFIRLLRNIAIRVTVNT